MYVSTGTVVFIGLLTAAVALPEHAFAAGSSAKTGTIDGTVGAKRKKHLANTVVYLSEVRGNYPAPSQPAVMDQKNQKFKPFVLPVLRGTTVKFKNSDATGHNVFTPDGEKYDLGVWGKGEERSHTYKKLGVYTQLCRMHPSMIAYVLVLQNPYFAITNSQGAFSIKNVPPGEYQLKLWNERKRADSQKIDVRAGQVSTVALTLKR